MANNFLQDMLSGSEEIPQENPLMALLGQNANQITSSAPIPGLEPAINPMDMIVKRLRNIEEQDNFDYQLIKGMSRLDAEQPTGGQIAKNALANFAKAILEGPRFKTVQDERRDELQKQFQLQTQRYNAMTQARRAESATLMGLLSASQRDQALTENTRLKQQEIDRKTEADKARAAAFEEKNRISRDYFTLAKDRKETNDVFRARALNLQEARQKFGNLYSFAAFLAGEGADSQTVHKKYMELVEEEAKINAKHRPASSTNNNVALTPGGIDLAARLLGTAGIMLPMGMGGTDERKTIINRTAELFPGTNVASNKATFDALRGSLTSMQRNLSNVRAFERTARKNVQQFLLTAKNVMDSGSPLLNLPVRHITRQMVSDPEFQAFQAARRVAVNEIARVTNSANLLGVLSDTARKEIESFHSDTATLPEIYAVAEILDRDMFNRVDSMEQEVNILKSLIGQNPQTPPLSDQVVGPRPAQSPTNPQRPKLDLSEFEK